MKIAEFFVQLGVNANTQKLKEFVGSMGELQVSTLTNISSISALVAELVHLGIEATTASVNLELFKNQTGLSTIELQKWQIAAQQANVSAEAVTASVTNLQKQMAEIRLGRGNIAPFQMLGIGVNGNAFDVLDKLRNRIKGLDAATATNLISQMGINSEMINVLKLSDTEFAKLSNTVRGLTVGQQEEFLRTKQSVVQLGLAFKYAGFDIVYHFLAAFEKFKIYISSVPGNMKLMISSIGLLVVALFPVQAALIGLLLLLDDLAVYFTGGKSLTGKGIEGLKKLGQELKESFNIPNLTNLTSLLAGRGALGPMAQMATAGIAGAKSLANTFNINVTGSGSAVDIANEVTRQIARHFSASEQQLDNQGH